MLPLRQCHWGGFRREGCGEDIYGLICGLSTTLELCVAARYGCGGIGRYPELSLGTTLNCAMLASSHE